MVSRNKLCFAAPGPEATLSTIRTKKKKNFATTSALRTAQGLSRRGSRERALWAYRGGAHSFPRPRPFRQETIMTLRGRLSDWVVVRGAGGGGEDDPLPAQTGTWADSAPAGTVQRRLRPRGTGFNCDQLR